MLAAIRPLVITMAFYGACVFTSCSSNDVNPVTPPEEEAYTGIPLVIFDTDIGSSTDDLFSLEILHYYQQQGRCKLLGVVVDREGEDCAACADVICHQMWPYHNCLAKRILAEINDYISPAQYRLR